MYVSRKVLTIKNIQQILLSMKKESASLHNALASDTKDIRLQKLDADINYWQQQITFFNDDAQVYKKLCNDIETAMASYENNHPVHAQQRSDSIFRVREWLWILQAGKQSPAEKHLALAQCIVRELNAVEHDHNKSSFSKLFSESRLAQAYMEVLRQNYIDPGAERYLSIEAKTIVLADEYPQAFLCENLKDADAKYPIVN